MSTEITKTEEKVEQPQVVQQTPVEEEKAPETTTKAVVVDEMPKVVIPEQTEQIAPKIEDIKKEEKTDLGEKNESSKIVEDKQASIPLEIIKDVKKVDDDSKPLEISGKRGRKKSEETVELTDTIRITPFHNQVLHILYKRNKHLYKRREDLLEELLNKALENDPVAQKVMIFIKTLEE